MVTVFKRNSNSIVHAFLDKIGVRYSSKYLDDFVLFQPHSNSLLGVQEVLSDYKVDNISLRISPEDLLKVETPVIVQLITPKTEFGIVTFISEEKIIYNNEKGKKSEVSFDQFQEIWKGIVLLSEKSNISSERDYTINVRKGILDRLRYGLSVLVLFGCLTYKITENFHALSLPLSGGILIYLNYILGTVISLILVGKTLDLSTSLFNKICNFNKESNCNNVLEGPASKFMGVISWSEVGLTYFIGSLLVIVLVPKAVPFLFLLNICSLPYTFWSINYQWRVAKEWCIFCVTVQLLIWASFFTYLASISNIAFYKLSPWIFMEFCLCFLWTIILLAIFIPYLGKSKQLILIKKELNNLKADESIFEIALQSGTYYGINDTNAQIYFGNPDAKFVLTMVTNPFCGPCSAMHKRVDELLSNFSNNIRIQLIFSNGYDNAYQNEAVKILIAQYKTHGPDLAWSIYEDWFNKGKLDIGDFLKRYPVDLQQQYIEDIYASHRSWCDAGRISATPTLFVDGFKLPDWYKIEDMKYFLSI